MNLTKDQEMVCGINAVNEIISIRPNSVTTLFIEDDKGKRIQELDQLAKQNNIEVVLQDSSFFQKNFSEMNHQSVAIVCYKRLEENENYLESLFEIRAEFPGGGKNISSNLRTVTHKWKALDYSSDENPLPEIEYVDKLFFTGVYAIDEESYLEESKKYDGSIKKMREN